VIEQLRILCQTNQNTSIFFAGNRLAPLRVVFQASGRVRNEQLTVTALTDWQYLHPGRVNSWSNTVERLIDSRVVWCEYIHPHPEKNMRKIALVLLATLAATPAVAQPKDCGELKAEIDAKISAKGVGSYTTTVVDNDANSDGAVIGTCENDTKKIVYKKA
jgi:hypothetical protein